MSHHLLAWFESVTGTAVTDIQPVQDNIFTIQNNHFFPQEDWQLLWALPQVDGADCVQARLVTPTYRQFSPPQILPGTSLLLSASTLGFPSDYVGNPFRVPKLEELELQMAHSAAGATEVWCCAAISRRIVPAPVGDIYTMRGTSTTATVANGWTTVATTWADTLPNGTYAVVGMRFVGAATAIAARLQFEDQVERPGCLADAVNSQQIPAVSRRGYSGRFGLFNQNRMPNVELLDGAATAAHTVFLDFVRVG